MQNHVIFALLDRPYLLSTFFPIHLMRMQDLCRKLAAVAAAGVISASAVIPATVAAPAAPSQQQMLNSLERRLEGQLRRDVTFQSVRGSLPGTMTVIGTAPGTGAQRFRIDCTISYPPLRISCTISFA